MSSCRVLLPASAAVKLFTSCVRTVTIFTFREPFEDDVWVRGASQGTPLAGMQSSSQQ